jgi:hypothetical protein
MTLYAITMSDAPLAIMLTVGDVSLEECLGKWPAAEQAKIVSHREIDPEDVPEDRSFRNAWTDNGKAIVVDMAKAREILRNDLRAQRVVALEGLDLAYLQADEVGDIAGKADIAAQKQRLRDATDAPEIKAAKTVDDLKAITLSAIVGRSAQPASHQPSGRRGRGHR